MNSSMLINLFKKYDFTFFGASLAIFIVGILNLYSTTHASSSPHLANLYKTQTMWYLLSVFIGFGISFIRPKNFFRYSYAIYAFNVFLLVLVLLMGHEGMGAQRWLVIGRFRIQPSELTKIAIVLALARWYVKNSPDKKLGIKELIIPAIITLVPTALIVAEPDLGTGLLVVLIFLVISFYRKLRWKTIFILGIVGMVSGVLWYNFGMKEFQKRRITAFLNPEADTRGSGYNAAQSKIAIGSGQFFGKGFKNSSQASLNYLPEKHTDFVFSIYNEEHGFLGAVLLLTLYLSLFYRFLWLAKNVPHFYNSIVSVGLMSIFFWHTLINMCMVMGLMPVVGLPLPLMSYGGSSLLTFNLCLGVATSISNSRNLF